jgi:hypothetical protein
MNRTLLWATSISAVLLISSHCQAVTIRYAIIIGNNIGVDADGMQPFPPLLHAEREATRLKRQLVEVANFDSSAKRTRLLLNADRASVVEAFESLARQRKEDAKLIEDFESIFLFYFTGHGISGKLLLSDGALEATRITELFNQVNADFSVGVFDACYAGSLDALLKKKGIRPNRGLNLAKEMPEQILSAKGSIWYVSSGANESSFEDKNKGGVFTHYFIEALNQANRDGPGITLDQIWTYARKKTISYTRKHNRRQTPEQFVSKLRSKASVYFSFPINHNATLVLSEKIRGTFALSYAEGHLVKIIEKQYGLKQSLTVLPGDAELFIFNKKKTERTSLTIKDGETLYIHYLPESAPHAQKGQKSENLFPKGIGVNEKITVTAFRPSASFMAGAGYEASLTHRKMLHPIHRVFLPFRIDWQYIYLGFRLIYGFDRRNRNLDSPYLAQMLGASLFLGRKFSFNKFEVNIGGDCSVAHIWQKFDSDTSYVGRKGEILSTVIVSLLFPINGKWFYEMSGHVGLLVAQGSAEHSTYAPNISGGWYLTAYFKGD